MYEAEKHNAPRSMQFAIFAIGLLWFLAARAGAASGAEGIAGLLRLEGLRPLLAQLFLLLLLLTGYTALNWVSSREGSVRASNALPPRATAGREWQKGVALGWALLLVSILPMVVAGDLHPQFAFSRSVVWTTVVSLLAALVGSLATEVAFRGFLFRRLVEAIGPVAATVVLSLLYAFIVTSPMNNTPYSFLVAFIGGVLFSLAYLRTHALWLGWGLRFGWLASMGVLFGLPVAGSIDLSGVVATDSSGRVWLTGGAYGPEGAVITGLVLLAGVIALYPLTRDYAWNYTHVPIVPGGYPMDVRPPAAHTAMEQAAAATPQLVQIQGLPMTPAAVAETTVAPEAVLDGPSSAAVSHGAGTTGTETRAGEMPEKREL